MFLNPPWTDKYLNHIFNEDMLARLNDKFQVRFVCPIRDGKYREHIAKHYASRSCFVKRFWDASSNEFRGVVNPVIFWEAPEVGAGV